MPSPGRKLVHITWFSRRPLHGRPAPNAGTIELGPERADDLRYELITDSSTTHERRRFAYAGLARFGSHDVKYELIHPFFACRAEDPRNFHVIGVKCQQIYVHPDCMSAPHMDIMCQGDVNFFSSISLTSSRLRMESSSSLPSPISHFPLTLKTTTLW